MQETKNWITNPTKKQMIFVVALGLTAFILLLLSMTNFLTESPFKGKYFTFYLLIFTSGVTVYRVCKAYYKNRKLN